MLRGENVMPWAATKLYKAVIQTILLYGSKTWNLSASPLVRLEGFHIHVANRMAREHQPRLGANNVWVNPKLVDVLEECGMQMIAENICKQRDTIALYVVTLPILEACKESERRRGSMPRHWGCEQPWSFK